MRFNPKARIDSGKVSDGGGGGGGLGGGGLGGGGMRLPIPTGLGGGKIGLLIAVIFFVVAMCNNGSLPGINQGDGGAQQNNATGNDPGTGAGDPDAYDQCKTGADANKSEACARVAIAASIEDFWTGQFKGGDFVAAPIKTFQGSTTTGCGSATSAVGPFYCPPDQTIYLDPTFFKDVLEKQLGGKGGDFVEPYVLGHEYGHHIQNITGQMKNVRTQQGENSDAVKLELQADCYAGLWTHHAETTKDAKGQTFLELDEADIEEAIGAAYTVGDDHIQEVTGGRVDSGSWTHGSSDERIKWFKTGYESGDFKACDIWK